MYLAGGILFIITGGVGVVYFIPKNSSRTETESSSPTSPENSSLTKPENSSQTKPENSSQTKSELEAYKKWIETKGPLPEGGQPNENALNALCELAKEETKDKDYKKWRDWINIRNDEVINKLVKIYMSNEVDISYFVNFEKPGTGRGIGYIIDKMVKKHATSLELAYVMGQTLHLLDNIGHDKKQAQIGGAVLRGRMWMHRSNKPTNVSINLDFENFQATEQPNLIPFFQVLLDHNVNPEAKGPTGFSTVELAGHYKLTIKKKGGKWIVSPKQE